MCKQAEDGEAALFDACSFGSHNSNENDNTFICTNHPHHHHPHTTPCIHYLALIETVYRSPISSTVHVGHMYLFSEKKCKSIPSIRIWYHES